MATVLGIATRSRPPEPRPGRRNAAGDKRDLDRVTAETRPAFPVAELQLQLAGLQADAFGDIQPALTALFAGAAFRAFDLLRQRDESAAGPRGRVLRQRILRQLLAEAFVLCLFGGVAGVIWMLGWCMILTALPVHLPVVANAIPGMTMIALQDPSRV